MTTEHVVRTPRGRIVSNPPLARMLFDDTRFAIVWLVVRLLVGIYWLNQALTKLADPAWMETGEAVKAFWTNAVRIPESGRPPIAFDWYRDFIQTMLNNQSYIWFAKFVAIGEFLVGVALILGLFVGLAAFFGAFMNWNYIMAGSASTNPILFVGAILLMLAWKTAGYYGLDRFVVPLLGATWEDEAAKMERERQRQNPPTRTPAPTS
jgi:thiosulfate dehydrogenase [quinone] large subunit